MSLRRGGSGGVRRHERVDYGRMMASALFTLALLGIGLGGAFWADKQYDLRKLLQIPSNVPDIAIPIALGLGAFGVLLVITTIASTPFYRSKKDELDEFGMYKRRDHD